jgi:hypothetical protein
MCDYSLHHVASRPATVGDKLVTTKFVNTPTGGFAALDNANVAVSAWRASGKSTWINLASITTRWNSPTVRSSW